jgi:hypothetical protein
MLSDGSVPFSLCLGISGLGASPSTTNILDLVEWAIVLHGMYESIFSIEMIHNCKKKYTYMPCGQHF